MKYGYRRFIGSFKTEAERKAYDALDALVTTGYIETAERIFAAAIADGWQEWYGKRHGLTLSSTRNCAAALLGIRCRGAHGEDAQCWPPGCDHPSLWMLGRTPTRLAFHPYGLTHRTINKLVAWCEENGMECQIDAGGSWHYPGQTVLVEIARPGEFSRSYVAPNAQP